MVQQHDSGLEEFIDRYDFEIVSEKDVDSFRLVTLVPNPINPAWDDDLPACGTEFNASYLGVTYGIPRSSFDVIVSGDMVIGAKFKRFGDYVIFSNGERANAYVVKSGPEAHVGLNVGEIGKDTVDFKAVFPSRKPYFTKKSRDTNMIVGYSFPSASDLQLSSLEVGLWNLRRAWDTKNQLTTHYDRDNAKLSDEGSSYAVEARIDGAIVHAQFPKTVPREMIEASVALCQTEVGWLKLPDIFPVVNYSVHMRQPETQKFR